MRTLTANTATKLSQNTGTEWLVVLEVDWVDGGTVAYSDQDFDGCETKVLSMAGFDTSMQLEGSSDSQELSIVLDDTDSSIRNISNVNDIHKRPARIYMIEKSLTMEDKIIVFRGELVTPIEWDENQRSVSFSVLSKLEERQVGFSMEEGDFPNIPDEALGKAWPLVFGQVCHLPAVKIRAPRRGYLQAGVGIHDFTLEPRICQVMKVQCPSQSTGSQSTYTQSAGNVWTTNTVNTVGPDLECVNRRYGEICRLKDLLEQQTAYEYGEITIYNGTSFPQNEDITLFIENATFRGYFSGNTFTINTSQHPEYADFDHVACRSVPSQAYGMTTSPTQFGGTTCTNAGGFWSVGSNTPKQEVAFNPHTWSPVDTTFTHFSANQTQDQAFASCDEALTSSPGLIGGPADSWSYYDDMEEASFFWAPAGSEVYMESESEILYIVSLLPGTVDGVAAFRTAPNGFKYLTEVTEDKYTVYETDYGGYQVVEIGMNKALTLYNDQWEDDNIYVSFTSSVGPNPCDIIEWLVNKYTDLIIDPTSFAAVHTALTNYPTNFYLTTRPDVYEVINDIAYQSRCSVYVRNNVLYIRYLSAEPTSERTLSETDILSGTFVEFLSETEDVYTTHTIKWQKGGASVRGDLDNDREVVLKYNVKKYGTVKNDWEYYCLNEFSIVLKTSTFWLIRKANSWKKVKFKLPFKHLDLDVGDTITLDVAQFGAPVKCVIESMNFNPDDYTIDVSVWSPIRTGEIDEFFWAWPASKPCVAVWPLVGDDNGGGGYDFEVTPPINSILLGGAHRDDQRVITSGDHNPSDLCDTAPDIVCELSDYLNFDEIEPDIIAKQIAQSASRQAMENTVTGGGNAGGANEEEEIKSECGVGPGCNYKVNIQWHKSEGQGLATALGGSAPGGPCGGPCACGGGCPSCYGPVWTVCHSFGAAFAAIQFKQYMEANYGKKISDYWGCGESGVTNAQAIDGTHSGPFAADCQSVGDSDGSTPPGASGAEIGEPTGTTGDEAG